MLDQNAHKLLISDLTFTHEVVLTKARLLATRLATALEPLFSREQDREYLSIASLQRAFAAALKFKAGSLLVPGRHEAVLLASGTDFDPVLMSSKEKADIQLRRFNFDPRAGAKTRLCLSPIICLHHLENLSETSELDKFTITPNNFIKTSESDRARARLIKTAVVAVDLNDIDMPDVVRSVLDGPMGF